MNTEGVAPAGAWEPCDGRRPPHTRRDQRPAWGAIAELTGTDTQPSVYAGLDPEGEMRRGTQAPIGHQPIPGLQAWMNRLHVGPVVGQQGGDDQLEEHPSARLEQPQEGCHGNAAPALWHRRLAARVLEGRGIGPGAARAIGEKGAMPVPPPLI